MKLINKDCFYAITEDLKYFKGKVDLIYIDPPFATGRQFKDKLGTLHYDDQNFSTKEYNGEINILLNYLEKILKPFEIDYLKFMYPRLCLLKELLSDKGSIYVHCDWHIGHYLKIILDDIFGKQNFVNEIVWKYFVSGRYPNEFAKDHDTLFVYSKNKRKKIFNYEKEIDEELYSKKKYENQIIIAEDGKEYYKYNGDLRTFEKQTTEVWNINKVKRDGNEILGYPTQKPEKLLERIIKASSNEDSIVLDCFCGSGTTLAVAQKLGRRWIGCDINPLAIDICNKRIYNLVN